MAYAGNVLRRAKARLEQARQNAAEESERRIRDIYSRQPRLAELDRAMRTTVAEAVTAAFRTGEDPSAAIAAAREKNLALQQERSWLLQVNELEESDLEPDVVCPHCGGTGYVGERMCECLRELCRQEQKKELSRLLAGRETFDGFRTDYYPVTDENGSPARRIMEKNRDRCMAYARDFRLGAPSLLFSGAPGLGKTFLSACIARQVAESGFSVVYETVTTLFAEFERAKFGGEEGITEKYLLCDLLIMDDLGTEMTTQFTQSVLYQVLNTRLMNGRPTVISTNLTSEELPLRYTAAIASRLLGAFDLLPFAGEDIRQR